MGTRDYKINGLDRYHPGGARYELGTIPRKKHLENILGRLTMEVGFIVEQLEVRNQQEPAIGFFAMTRMVMPIIEAVATAEGIEPQGLLARLGQGSPTLSWVLYRDGLTHNDEQIAARVGDRAVGSMLVFTPNDGNHETAAWLAAEGRSFDAFAAYRNLVTYLEKAISEAGDEEIEIVIGISFDPESKRPDAQAAVADLLALDDAARAV